MGNFSYTVLRSFRVAFTLASISVSLAPMKRSYCGLMVM